MFYRDNRLNPIHEGTTGIQSLDLLARKVPMNNLKGYLATLSAMESVISEAEKIDELKTYADDLVAAIATLRQTTDSMLGFMMTENIDLALANSVKYLELFGNVVIAWLWLRQGVVASRALQRQPHGVDENFYRGKLQALRYFFKTDLPSIDGWSKLLMDLDSTSYDMKPEWF
jgi:butyryl-CoA dehydrogenase